MTLTQKIKIDPEDVYFSAGDDETDKIAIGVEATATVEAEYDEGDHDMAASYWPDDDTLEFTIEKIVISTSGEPIEVSEELAKHIVINGKKLSDIVDTMLRVEADFDDFIEEAVE